MIMENGCSKLESRLKLAGGFTLIEMMVVIIIISILSSIAYPSYVEQVKKSRRSDAISALSDAASRQEQFYLNNKSYTTAFDNSGINLSTTTESGFYELSVAAPTASCPINRCYVLTATPQGAQADDSCAALSLSSTGTKLPAECW